MKLLSWYGATRIHEYFKCDNMTCSKGHTLQITTSNLLALLIKINNFFTSIGRWKSKLVIG
jgi:hypothetical protein